MRVSSWVRQCKPETVGSEDHSFVKFFIKCNVWEVFSHIAITLQRLFIDINPLLPTARYSFEQLSELKHGVNRILAQVLKQ